MSQQELFDRALDRAVAEINKTGLRRRASEQGEQEPQELQPSQSDEIDQAVQQVIDDINKKRRGN